MYGWMRANRLGNLDIGTGSQTLQSAMMLNEELIQLRQQVKEQEKEIRRLKKENNFWEEDECNDTYGRSRMYQALILKRPEHGRNPQWTYHLPCHGGNWDQPSSQAQTERDHEIRQGSQKVG